MNFSLPIKKIDGVATYLGFEKYINQLSEFKPISKQKEVIFKTNLVLVAHYFCKVPPNRNSFINTQQIRDSLTKIKNNKANVIAKQDKGSWVVILNIDDYNSKMMKIITDRTIFKELGYVKDNLTTIKLKKNIWF